ncbi:hypothetical protein BTO05_08260 [Winogradskyella sp. PC-19]|uniref:hypothetical protein n=1 Tax=unclassified Winogradskyella TaxID=2615021 RepID=UPI000B3C7F11|nr:MULTISPECIES: hypothetical protein [unclassified Winogradskyella]ARV09633.1 hypothetical protein BTO05_08260 [Winogradskyella sp. PC-19]RZN83309.1 MAG: hypothetical protein EVB12_01750 [Winogradskyella sp.]
MSITKNVFFVVISLFFATIAIGQVDPLYNYDVIDIDDYNGYSKYRLQGKKYYLHHNKITKNKDSIIFNEVLIRDKDTILNIKTDNITFFSILKKRYLFVSYYPKEQKGSSLGFSLRNLGKVDVIDLKHPTRKWYFDLKDNFGLDLRGIVDFKPAKGEIIFNYKFSINTNKEMKSIIPGKNSTRY